MGIQPEWNEIAFHMKVQVHSFSILGFSTKLECPNFTGTENMFSQMKLPRQLYLAMEVSGVTKVTRALVEITGAFSMQDCL